MQSLVPTDTGPMKDNQWIGERVMGAQGSLMYVRSEDYLVWRRTGIGEKVDTGYDRKVSEHTAHLSLYMRTHSWRVLMLTPAHHWKLLQWAWRHQTSWWSCGVHALGTTGMSQHLWFHNYNWYKPQKTPLTWNFNLLPWGSHMGGTRSRAVAPPHLEEPDEVAKSLG